MSKRVSARRRLNTSIKVAALVAALGFVTVMIEQPGLTASPRSPVASVEQSLYSSDVSGTAMASSASRPASNESPLPASEYSPTYFPSQFAPPNGEIESQPPTF